MTTYRIEFGRLGEGRPVPDLTVTAADRAELVRAVTAHAIPHLAPVLTELGRPEAADCWFEPTADMTAGQFLHIDLAHGRALRFCGARIAPTTA